MNISIENYRFRESFGDEKTVDILKGAGFDAMDFSYYWTKRGERMLGDDWKEKATKLRRIIDEKGFACNQAHAPFDLVYGEKFDMSEAKYEALVRSIGSAAILGAKQIIVHCLKTPNESELMEYNFAFYKSLEKYCEEYGIKVSVENLFTSSSVPGKVKRMLGTPEELCELTLSLGKKNFNCCVDLGHVAITETLPEDFISRMDSELLGALHVHDNDFGGDQHLLPYLGRMDWNKIMAALKAKNYAGDLTLEVFGWLGRLPEGLMCEGAHHAAVTAMYLREMFVK